MGVTVAVTRVACPTSTGTQDITTADLGGLTPKAAWFIVTYATADGTAADHAHLGVGAVSDASNRWVEVVAEEHNVSTIDCYTSGSTSFCVRIINPTDGTVDGEADFSAWISDGIRINWSNAPSAAFLLTVILFAGTDFTGHAGNVALGDTIDNAVDVTAVGFRPRAIMAAMHGADGQLSLGVVHENGSGTVTQRAVNGRSRDGQPDSVNTAMMRNDAGALEMVSPSNLDFSVEFSSFDSSGFTVTTRNAGGNNRTLCYLAMTFGGVVDAWVGHFSTPTSTGDQANTSPAFQPQALIMIPSLCEAVNTGYNDSRAYSWGMSAIDADEQYSNIITSQDASSVSNTQSLSDNVAASVPDHAGTLDIEATLVSLDATGWTLNFSNIFATAKLWPVLAIEVSSAGGGSTYAMSATLTGISDTNNPSVQVTRALSAALTGNSDTNNTALQVVRPLSAALTGVSNTGDISLQVIRQLAATLTAQSDTTNLALFVLRQVTATLTAQSNTTDAALQVIRQLAATLTAISSTTDIALQVSGLIEMAATLTAQSATTDAALQVIRQLAATLTAVSDTSNAAITGTLQALATLTANSNTGNAALQIARASLATLTAQSNTDEAVLQVIRALSATLTAQSSTTNIVIVTAIIEGLVRATFTANKPSSTFTAIKPGSTFTAIKPGATFET